MWRTREDARRLTVSPRPRHTTIYLTTSGRVPSQRTLSSDDQQTMSSSQPAGWKGYPSLETSSNLVSRLLPTFANSFHALASSFGVSNKGAGTAEIGRNRRRSSCALLSRSVLALVRVIPNRPAVMRLACTSSHEWLKQSCCFRSRIRDEFISARVSTNQP